CRMVDAEKDIFSQCSLPPWRRIPGRERQKLKGMPLRIAELERRDATGGLRQVLRTALRDGGPSPDRTEVPPSLVHIGNRDCKMLKYRVRRRRIGRVRPARIFKLHQLDGFAPQPEPDALRASPDIHEGLEIGATGMFHGVSAAAEGIFVKLGEAGRVGGCQTESRDPTDRFYGVHGQPAPRRLRNIAY